MASITTWVRIESRSRSSDLLPGSEARLHDPLWLIARQWQLGELTGADAGSPALAQTSAEVTRLDAIRTTAGWQAFDPDHSPLVTALATAPGEPSVHPRLATRARAGQQLQRMLRRAGVDGQPFLVKFPLTVSAGEMTTLDAADQRFLAVVTGRVPDGDAAAAALAPLLAQATSQLPSTFGIVPAQLGAASSTCYAWLAWRQAFEQLAPAPAWRSEELAYRFDARVPAAGHDIVLTAARHKAETVRWFDVDASAGDPATRTAHTVTSTTLPTRVHYRGMPARRYWALEDRAVAWPGISAGPGDIGRILFVEMGLTFGDHWMVIPFVVPAGSVCHVLSLNVTDTFGVSTTVRSASDLDGDAGPWRFLELARSGKLSGPLVFLPPATSQLVGRPCEAVDLARDDRDSVLWAVDRLLLGADGHSRDVPPATSSPAAAPDLPAYRLGPAIDPAYHPYRARIDAGGLALALASIPGTTTAPRPDLPSRIRAHAVSAVPMRVATRAVLARSPDGVYHLVSVRTRDRVAAPPAPLLTFDVIEEPR